VCHEKFVLQNKESYVRDEGRPLGIGLQEQVSNQCMQL